MHSILAAVRVLLDGRTVAAKDYLPRTGPVVCCTLDNSVPEKLDSVHHVVVLSESVNVKLNVEEAVGAHDV